MTKRVLSIILALVIFSVPVLANVSFWDLPDSHWGYPSVNKLVNDGTVKGYEDGSFRPDNSVTRAEFVKMMGMGSERRETEFTDVSKEHWGYDYIMTSGFETTDTAFYPDKAITRGEVIELLWKRQGSEENLIAPSVITNQYEKNKNAVSWAYNHKIMMGDDGVNLRLSDGVSRVEAAALIIRTRETDYNASNVNFKDAVSEDLLKAVFASFDLFDSEVSYSEAATLTNGQMARAALRIAAYEKNLTYGTYNVSYDFEHQYAKDVAVIAEKCLGSEYKNAEFCDKAVTVEDAVAMLSFAIVEKTNSFGFSANKDNYYKDVSSDMSVNKNIYLTIAYENGIQLKANGELGAKESLTHKDLAALLLQFDRLFGAQTIYSTLKDNNGSYICYDAKLNGNLFSYPSNYSDFACIIENVDKEVYEKEIKAKGTAKEMYSFAREFSGMFIPVVEKLSAFIKSNYNAETELVMYPNLVWDNGRGFTLRVKCKVLSAPDGIDVQEMCGDMLVSSVSGNLSAGMEFFIEIEIGYSTLIGA